MFNWEGKRVLVTGSMGLIGSELVLQLKELGAFVIGVDKKLGNFFDLSYKKNVEYIFETWGPFDYVFHLMGVKGSPQMTQNLPVDFMAPMLQCDINMIVSAQKYNAKGFLYTSSIALLNLHTDKFPGTAKQTAETLIDAMRIQYPKGTKYCIARPASVYGRFENFDRDGLMFVSKMIKEALCGNDLELWNDGASIRDIVNSKDVAKDMIEVMQQMPEDWVGIGGDNYTIKEIAETIAKYTETNLITNESDKTNDSRVIERKWNPERKRISLDEGIKEVVEHVRNNRNTSKEL